MSRQIVPVVLAGGRGTRLWPLSRAARPKQFLQLTGPVSLFQETLKRVSDHSLYLPALVITNHEYRFLVAEQALEIGSDLSGVLLEPMSRNTALAIASAALFAQGKYGEDVVLHVLPSDHSVVPDEGYWRSIHTALGAAQAGNLVTFGITPTAPQAAYGYIEAGEAISPEVQRVARFVEKPPLEKAEAMVTSGNFLWNAGIFMMSAADFLEDCRSYAPQTYESAQQAVSGASADLDFVRLNKDAFEAAPDISVDYAVFEKTARAAVVPVNYKWSDLGSWDAVWNASDKDEAGNVAQGSATFSNTTGSLVISEKAHIAVEGLENMAVIATEDAIFVGKLSEAQKVGAIVSQLRQQADTVHLTELHKTAYRPWGGYSSVLSGERFQVKRLFVHPGKKLSLQRHHHRSEHWIVVRGTAEVTVDDRVSVITENQSIYLPLGATHRLANPGKILLELIEVQTGSYLGEDDIIRIEDDFGRT
ncbi:mannose-1-phosphate guanylyltransferase/mannose-6-phosphate isomerase [Devosia sp. 1635]|uniref:mannose-1-phosphate guanylyltransferase/mannose-6-phosphate isomerase n=1 Tax=Devosia sp. 1635 TaxID=2726066 RepID=UPI0015672003|nr:mannose-1-phosphate guanylyltransferase/mannose-6-phosphate isomerase [Devosia sp. 1635]